MSLNKITYFFLFFPWIDPLSCFKFWKYARELGSCSRFPVLPKAGCIILTKPRFWLVGHWMTCFFFFSSVFLRFFWPKNSQKLNTFYVSGHGFITNAVLVQTRITGFKPVPKTVARSRCARRLKGITCVWYFVLILAHSIPAPAVISSGDFLNVLWFAYLVTHMDFSSKYLLVSSWI